MFEIARVNCIKNIVEKRRNFSSFPQYKKKYCRKEEKFLLISTIFCYLLLDFHDKTGTRFLSGDKRLFKVSGVEIMKVDCNCIVLYLIIIKCVRN